jgi:hypothetical protein
VKQDAGSNPAAISKPIHLPLTYIKDDTMNFSENVWQTLPNFLPSQVKLVRHLPLTESDTPKEPGTHQVA